VVRRGARAARGRWRIPIPGGLIPESTA
jgi:hypothetical protein